MHFEVFMSFTVGTYNVAKPGQRGLESWSIRRDLISNLLAQHHLDIVCLQELSGLPADQSHWIEATNKLGYKSLYESKKSSSGLGLLFKQEKFNLIGERRGEFSAIEDGRTCTRSFVMVDLKDKTSEKVIRVVSLHLYGGSRHGNTLGEKQLRSFREQIESNDANVSEIILAGDFNSDLDEELAGSHSICRYLLEPSSSLYRYRTVTHDSNNNKIATSSRHKRHLDWIFVGKKVANIGNSSLVSKLNYLPIVSESRASDHSLHAIQVCDQLEVYAPLNANHHTIVTHHPVKVINNHSVHSNSSLQDINSVKEKLSQIFKDKPAITREDIVAHFGISRNEANGYTTAWGNQGLLIQNGRGRGTTYHPGPNLFLSPVSAMNKRDFLSSLFDVLFCRTC